MIDNKANLLCVHRDLKAALMACAKATAKRSLSSAFFLIKMSLEKGKKKYLHTITNLF